jgi:hypothetical protein
MLEIDFSGWFQCRLATDPDAFDHPRGESGWTFAFPGEPDLDRIIRFQDPLAPRSRCPQVGVRVRAVRRDGAAIASPLDDLPVVLLDDAVFEGRNGQIATSANEPVVPFHLRVQSASAGVAARDPIDVTDPAELTRRQPVDFASNSPVAAQATGITNRAAYRASRRGLLEADLTNTADPVARAALERRIAELAKGSIRLSALGFQMSYAFDLRGPSEWHDPEGTLGPPPGAGAPWSIGFWLGAWDADALCGFVQGTLRIG